MGWFGGSNKKSENSDDQWKKQEKADEFRKPGDFPDAFPAEGAAGAGWSGTSADVTKDSPAWQGQWGAGDAGTLREVWRPEAGEQASTPNDTWGAPEAGAPQAWDQPGQAAPAGPRSSSTQLPQRPQLPAGAEKAPPSVHRVRTLADCPRDMAVSAMMGAVLGGITEGAAGAKRWATLTGVFAGANCGLETLNGGKRTYGTTGGAGFIAGFASGLVSGPPQRAVSMGVGYAAIGLVVHAIEEMTRTAL